MSRKILIVLVAALFVWVAPAQSADIKVTVLKCTPPSFTPRLSQGEQLCFIGRDERVTYVRGFMPNGDARWYRVYGGGSEDYIGVRRGVVVAAGVLEHGRRSFWRRPSGKDPDPENTLRWEVEYDGMRPILSELAGG